MIDFFLTTPQKYKSSAQYEKELLDVALSMFGNSKQEKPNFPKYNVYRMLDGSPYTYYMEFALAGYTKDSLDIKLDRGYLVLASKTSSDKKEEREYTYSGVSNQDFFTKFYLGDDVEIQNAKFVDGLLTLEVEKMVPEEQKPKSVVIT